MGQKATWIIIGNFILKNCGPYQIYLVPLYLVAFAYQTEQKYRRNSGRSREKQISGKCMIQIAALS